MEIPYELFTDAFLSKISEYTFMRLSEREREHIVDGYMKRSVTAFKRMCNYALTADDENRVYVSVNDTAAEPDDADEIVDIVSEGMVVQWLKPYINKQELLQNVLNTRDYSAYSPAELLKRVREAYEETSRDHLQMMREYTYNHMDLRGLHI